MSEAAVSGRPPDGGPHARLEFLDALRGLAAGVVVVQHLPTSPPAWFAWINPGRAGVIAFFLISGFVIPLSLGSIRRPGGFAAFWVGRFFRLFPAYWVSLALAVPFGLTHGARLKDWLANIALLQLPLHAREINLVAWTLILEIIVYAALSIGTARNWLARPGPAVGLALGGIAVIGLLIPFATGHRVPAGALACLAAATAGFAWHERFRGRLPSRMAELALVGALALTLATGYVSYVHFPKTHGDVEVPFLAGAVATVVGYALFLAFYAGKEARFPRWALAIGTVSYPWYLFHGFALGIAWSNPTFLGIVTAVALSLLLAWLIHESVENPANALGRRLRERLLKRASAA